MKLKTLIVTVAILAALSIAAYFSGRQSAPTPPDPRVGQPLLDAAVAASATRVTLADQGKTVTVSRRPDGTWVVDNYFGLKADFAKLSQFVSDMTSAKVTRFVTATPERLARMEFKDTRIELSDSQGKTLWGIVLGKTPDSGSGRFFEFSGEQRAFLTGLNAWIDSDPKNWADSQLTSFKEADVARIEMTLGDLGAVSLQRKSPTDPWTCSPSSPGRAVKADKVASLLATLSTIRFSDTSDPKDPAVKDAQSHAQKLTLGFFSGKSMTLVVSRKPEEKRLKAPVADSMGGPASLGKLADVANKEAAKAAADKPVAPEFETIPAGPVFIAIADSDPKSLINNEMNIRAFQTDESVATGLPSKADDLFEAPAKAAPTPKAG